MMQLHVLDHIFVKFTLDDVKGTRILPVDSPTRVTMSKDPIWMSAFMHLFKKADYPTMYLTYIGNMQGPSNNMINNRVLTWFDMNHGYINIIKSGME
jgi:hypothetical protein